MNMRKVVIPVAELGTRFLPAMKAITQEMPTVAGCPTIQYMLHEYPDGQLIEQLHRITGTL